MTRELKFRAWDIYKKVFIPTDTWAVTTSNFSYFAVMLKDWEDYREGEYMYYVSQILSQYTGLKDSKGVDIYEGDILKSWYSRDMTGKDIVHTQEVVEYEIQQYTGEAGYELLFLEKAEIIGNIYENPNLL